MSHSRKRAGGRSFSQQDRGRWRPHAQPFKPKREQTKGTVFSTLIGLGIALAQPKLPVVVITGDGEMLMGIGSLATVGLQKPGNLTIVVLDNEVYGETGGQASHTGANTDLVGVARACGLADIRTIATLAEIEAFRPSIQDVAGGPRFVSIKIDSANLERVLASRDGSYIVTRIRGALGFTPI